MDKISSFTKNNISSFLFYLQTVWHGKKSISILMAAVSFLWIFFSDISWTIWRKGNTTKPSFG